MRKNNKYAKATRRKGAIERLEKNISDYVILMKETKDKDVLKKYEQKIERHRTAIENTKKNLKNI